MASLGERTRLLKDVLGWWWQPSPGRLRTITRQLEQARAEVTDPFETLNDDIIRLWPDSASLHDPRWHLLSHSGVQRNCDPRVKAHWRCALVMAWLDRAPDEACRAWGRGLLMERADLAGYHQAMTGDHPEHEEAALRAGLRCALSLEHTDTPLQARPQSEAFGNWALGLAMAMGWEDEISASATAGGAWSVPDIQALLWVACFDRGEVLGRMIGDGCRLKDEIRIPGALFERATGVCIGWGVRLGPTKDRTENQNKTAFFPGKWGWRDFGVAHWLANAGARRCLDVALPQGIVLREASKQGQTAVLVCMQMLDPAMAAAMIENGARTLIEIDKVAPNRMMAKACLAIEALPEMRDAYVRALEAMRTSHAITPWRRDEIAYCMIEALDGAAAPALLGTLVKMMPDWSGFSYGDVTLMDRAIIGARAHPQAGVLRVLAGPNPGLMDDTVQHTAWGMMVAAVDSPALAGWLAHAGVMEKQQLADHRADRAIVVRAVPNKGDGEGEIVARLIEDGDHLAEVVLRSGDPVGGMGAIMAEPVIAATVLADTVLMGRLWAKAMTRSDKGEHEALEAVLAHLPAPAWGREDVVPAWAQLLSKPRNEALVERAIQTCPVQVRVDKAGNTPLHLAMTLNDASAVEWLAAAGADPDEPNTEGRSARAMADSRLLAALACGQAGNMQAAVVEAVAAPARPANRF